MAWVKVFDDQKTVVEHLDGVAWLDAPKPRRLHRCSAQTRGWMDYFIEVERCACGALRMPPGPWKQRNSR